MSENYELIFHLNVRGLGDKTLLLEDFISDFNIKFVCLSEHFVKMHDVSKIKICKYKIASIYCRNKLACGGTAILVKNDIEFVVRSDLLDLSVERSFECTAIDAELCNKACTIVCIYRSPNSDLGVFLSKLEYVVSKILREKKVPVICGDFNIDLVDDSSNVKLFKEMLLSCNLEALISTPTRICATRSSLLDNVLTSSYFAENVNSSDVINCPFSDHDAQIVTFNDMSSSVKNEQYCKKRVFTKAKILEFSNFLEYETFDSVYDVEDVDSMFKNFHDTFLKYFLNVFPLQNKKSNSQQNINNQFTSFLTPGLKISRHKLNLLQKLKHKNPELYTSQYVSKYKFIYFKLLKLAKKNHNTQYVNKSNNKSKAMWQIINQKFGKSKSKQDISSITVNNENVSDLTKIANAFSDHFEKSISDIKDQVPKVNSDPKSKDKTNLNQNSMFLTPISIGETYKFINKLKNKQSCGFDGVPDSLLKSCAPHLSTVLTHIINASFVAGVFPSILKTAIVKPLYKKGSRSNINNYRPISLLSVFSKIFERAYLSRLVTFLEHNRILSKFQNGFRKGKSTETAIFDLVESILSSVDSRNVVTGMFVDLSKAFDTVEHKKLFEKLDDCGIRGKCLDWVKSFLSNRKQYVKIQDSTSNCKGLMYGLPQGALTSPIFFLIYINDMHLICTDNEEPVIYADDSNFRVQGDCNESASNNSINTLIKVKNWLNSNGLAINQSKTEFIHFRNIHNNNAVKINQLICPDQTILASNSTSFLGVVVDEFLRWGDHVDFICKKLSSVIFAMGELRHECDLQCLKTLYFANFQSIFKYAIICYGNSSDAERVFILQKKVVRLMCFVKKYDHCKPLFQKLNLLTFTCVYLLECAMKVKKYMSYFSEHVVQHNHDTRHKNTTITPVLCRTQMCKNGPFQMCIAIYNKLPIFIKCIQDTKHFKTKLKDLLISKCFYDMQSYFNHNFIEL
jgi:Reverse transcriptase (RNA-dependent DNA polymerase)